MELQVFYQKRSCNYVRGILCGLPEKVTGMTDLKTVSVREEEPESTPEDSREDTTEDVGKVKEEDTAKKKDDAVPDTEDRSREAVCTCVRLCKSARSL